MLWWGIGVAVGGGIGVAGYVVTKRARQTRAYLTSNRFPEFVRRDVDSDTIGIPVFTYHSVATPHTPDSVTPQAFEHHLQYLKRNGYHTLTADELHAHLVFGERVPPKSVVLTFDDGRATLWTIAYPLLKKYEMRAVCFLVPGAMTAEGVRPHIGDAPEQIDDLANADVGDAPVITWAETRLMHESGIIDFQSHTRDHALIYCGPEIVDFANPHSDYGYGGYALPLRRCHGEDVRDIPALGTPIYRSMPRMGAARRYYDDERLRQACVAHVAENGGAQFFERGNWRDTLSAFVKRYRHEHGDDGRYESPDEQRAAIHDSLVSSKQMIEEHLPGHIVRHLCYPWHRYSIMAASLAIESGYVSTFVDINHHKLEPTWNAPYAVQHAIPVNTVGDDPYLITRIDSRDDLILSLPGEGRLTMNQRIRARMLRVPQRIKRLYANARSV
ncbi:MAG: hypothetical protein D6737_03735 [Chloroflexi bacterium]|nr:MAG: hypothetical protein CUN54_05450 [Phototrophicales bacterium]RMF81828.1 MAG: hypothetical protein D6737_03735 [Chloroflexota bacterium]